MEYRLLLAIDFSETTDDLVARIKKFVRGFSARLWLIHVAEPEPDFVGFDPGPQSVRDDQALKYRREHRELQRIAEELKAVGIDATPLLVQGSTVETILREAEKLQIDMVAVGSHGKGAVKRLLVGSVSEGVLRRASIPVIVVPSRRDNRTEGHDCAPEA